MAFLDFLDFIVNLFWFKTVIWYASQCRIDFSLLIYKKKSTENIF